MENVNLIETDEEQDGKTLTIEYTPLSTRKKRRTRAEMAADKDRAIMNKINGTPITVTDPQNASEVLLNAINRVIHVYNKVAESITEEEIKEMKTSDKILALQKLSYIHAATKKTPSKTNMNFFKINSTKASVEDLEAAIINVNQPDEE